MSRQLRRAAQRRMHQVLLGGRDRSQFDAEVLAAVDAVGDLAYRLESRGWRNECSGPDLAWDWTQTALGEDEGGDLDSARLPCTSVVVDHDEAEIGASVVLVGEPDALDGDHPVAVAVLTDELLSQLERYEAGNPAADIIGQLVGPTS